MVDHPDEELVQYLVNGFKQGFRLGMTQAPHPCAPCPNSREVQRKPNVMQELVDKEIALGHILRPFDEPLLPNMVFSLLNIVLKAGSPNHYRLLHDLAYPYGTDQSVNSCILEENSSVQYHYIDEVIDMGIEIGVSATAARVDAAFAFRNQPMHRDQLCYLGFTLNGKYYINSSLPFGAASSCKIFEKVATALQWIVTHETGNHLILHFLDDFPLLWKSFQDVQLFIGQFCSIMK